ncbi:uncharacterized protein LOC132182124 [Corylus avellana]|uniref:uncharacterized protein LOC132182124 n=1 Tax=Corylus avellana TaxID=13451 RepID=UPI00286A1CFD|nr:uncharacterized protein LOC132182124 [Corylus avellana]
MAADQAMKAAARDIIISPLLATLEHLLSFLTPPEDADFHLLMDYDRTQAEVIFDHCSQQYPNTLLLKLTDLLLTTDDFILSCHYATRLRSVLAGQLTEISPMLLTELKARIFACLQRYRLTPVYRNLSKSISIVASRVFITQHGDWQELLDYILLSLNSNDNNVTELGLYLFCDLPLNTGRFLRPEFDYLYLAFLRGLSSPNIVIRLSAYTASAQLVKQLADFDVDKGDLLPEMLNLLIDLLNDKSDINIQEGLKELVCLAKIDPSFFTNHLRQLCESMVQIAEDNYLLEDTRYAAIDVIMAVNDTATDEMSTMIRNLHGEIVNRLISTSMGMLVRIEDDPTWYIEDDPNKGTNAGKTRSYDLGLCLLNLVSSAVSGTLGVPIALDLIQQYVYGKEWEMRLAGIITLAVVATRHSKEIVNYLGRVVAMISITFHDLKSRVRWLTERAALEIRLFSKDCIRNDLTLYLEKIVSRLLVLLQNENQKLQEEAMATLASIAISSQDQFHPYYDATMASLKAIFFNKSDASNSKRMLRAKSVECISSIAVAVGKEKFMNDATKVIKVLVSLQKSLLDTDHSIRIHLLQAWLGFCKCLGRSSEAYVSELVPIFLRSAELSVDDNDVDTDEPPHDQSDLLREKALACNLLCCFAVQLKENFFTWVSQVSKILVPLLLHPHLETRMASASAMPELLCSAILAVQKGESGGRSMSFVQNLATFIVPALVKALKEVTGLNFPQAQIGPVADGMKHVLAVHSCRNLEMAGREADEDFNMEEEESIEKRLEDVILHQAGNCLITMIKVFKAGFMPYFEKLSSDITAMLGDDRTAREKTIAFSISNCVIQQCQEAAHKYYDTYLPFLLKVCDDENSDVKQEAAHGIGVCAEFAQSKFKNIAEVAVVSLNSVISHSNPLLSSENRKTYDTAVLALGKICKFHRESINAPQVVPTWLGYLPIEDDPTEAKVVHEELCSMVERSDKELLGPDNLHVPKITEVFAKIVAKKDNLATEETADRMAAVLKRFEKLQLQ